MITFLTSPKPFIGRNKQNQIRAIRSWLAVAPDVEVIVYGEAVGAEEICTELGIQYVPEVDCTESGLPYFNAIVKHACEQAKYDTQVYINCDILLNSSLAEAVQHIPLPQYLMIGQRVDLEGDIEVDPTSDDLLSILVNKAEQKKVVLHGPTGKDYFVFKRGMWKDLPPIVIGRGAYDTALLAHCLYKQMPVVDGTFSVVALHQFHDYAHVPGGKTEVMQGKDALYNRRNSGMWHSAPTIADSPWVLCNNKLLSSASRGDHLRALEMNFRFNKKREAPSITLRILWRFLTGVGFYRPEKVSLLEILDAWQVQFGSGLGKSHIE